MTSEKRITVKIDQPSHYQAPESGTWRDRLRRFRMLVAYRHYRLILRRFAKPERGNVIAEIGCGPGYLLGFLEAWFPGCTVVGFDYDYRLLENASERTEFANLIRGNAEILPFGDGTFDVLVTMHLIEHLYYPERFISEARRVLKAGGILLLGTPNPNGIGAKVMEKRWGGYREDHVSLKSPEEWAALFKQHGFYVIKERTTGLSGIPAFRKLPLVIFNWGLLALFGAFPWKYGEAYMGVFEKYEK